MRGIVLFTIFISSQSVIFSAVINVPGDYPAIQQAIDVAVAGDTVLVAPGTYVENINFKGKAITVKGDQGAGVTIIDGNQAGSVVKCQSGEGLDSVLEGFTLINGNSGGGISCSGNSSLIIANTILWDNSASIGPEMWVGSTSSPSTLTISYSDVKGGKNSVYVAPGCTLNWGPGMIDSDPLFVDEANDDFHLTFNSPCRGSGDNSAVKDLYDFEGDPRIAYGTVDMGADEFYAHLYWTGDATPGGNVEIKFVGLPGTAPVGLCIGTGVLDPPLKSMWGDWYLKFPLLASVGLGSIPSPEGVLVLPFTFPANTPTPLSLPFQAGVGMELSNLSVLEIK